jgi:predicted O-linked N-acetylglucosamine transferase (SPINDLY family)
VDVVEKGSAAVNPFIFLSLETTPRQQFLCARRFATEHVDTAAAKLPAVPARCITDGRITVGYLSADFQEHATAHLTAALFALHDRTRFRVIAYSYGADDGSPMRRRLVRTFDQFVDLISASHAEAAARIRADGVDILVDLKGYTRDARPQIAASRPAPVQVSYLGYPGTMGTDAIDYVLADAFVLPADQQSHYSEKIVHLPGSYQANDCRRPIAAHVPTRGECGLPESGFVFCCFNSSEKITPRIFDVWIRLLAAVPGSVLWLLASSPQAVENLSREAEARLTGAATRLVFAPTLPNPDHLSRFALAGLFLDTLPYNAHTLAADALWAGCPVLTCACGAFPSRVAGSLLRAAGLPELVTESLADYEALALRLAADPAGLEVLRERLRSTRLTVPLFDSMRFTRQIEAAFEIMWHRYLDREPPRPFSVTREGHELLVP